MGGNKGDPLCYLHAISPRSYFSLLAGGALTQGKNSSSRDMIRLARCHLHNMDVGFQANQI